MKKRVLIDSALVMSLYVMTLLPGCCINIGDLFKAKCQTTQQVSVPLKDINELDVDTNVGSITVTGDDVTDCNITAEITVKAGSEEKARKLAEEVKIEFQSSDSRLGIKVRKPDSLPDRALVANFTIRAPKQLNLNCSTHVGSVNISDIKGRIRASTNVGSIICDQVVADLQLIANVGSIKAKCSDVAPTGCDVEITTNVGSISFAGPSQMSAQLNASANLGEIRTRRPITVVGSLKKSIKGTVGTGEGKIDLRTNIGSIEIE